MNIRTKIKLVIEIQLTNDEILIIDKESITNIDKIIAEENYNELESKLETKIEELIKKNKEIECLEIAHIISKIRKRQVVMNFNFPDELDDYDNNEEEEEDENKIDDDFTYNSEDDPYFLSKEDRKLQREATKKLKALSAEEIQTEFHDFVLKEFPKILVGYDRSIFKTAKQSYWNKQNIFNKWEVPSKVSDKITLVEHKVEDMLKKSIQEHSTQMYDIWLKQFVDWSKKLNLKKTTKQNIKDFFKEIGVKPTETLVQRIKEDC